MHCRFFTCNIRRCPLFLLPFHSFCFYLQWLYTSFFKMLSIMEVKCKTHQNSKQNTSNWKLKKNLPLKRYLHFEKLLNLNCICFCCLIEHSLCVLFIFWITWCWFLNSNIYYMYFFMFLIIYTGQLLRFNHRVIRNLKVIE